ncbi:MAG: OadG family protein [Clostridiales Family XIII bacterium]|nr:OadG family protein [Clostridiales Family XIII bacterium]
MSFAQSLLTGVFCMSVVFAALIALWALIRFSSVVIAKFEAETPKQQDASARR